MRKSPTFLWQHPFVLGACLFFSLLCGLKAQNYYEFRTSPSNNPVVATPTGTYRWEETNAPGLATTYWLKQDPLNPGTPIVGTIADGAGSIVNIETDVVSSGTATITLETTKTVGFLNLADFNNNGIFVLAQKPSTSGMLVMDGGGNQAFLNNFIAQSTLSFPTISAPIQISNAGNLDTGILNVNVGVNGNFMTIISGTVTGGSIYKTGGGDLKLTGTYTPGAGGKLLVAMRGFGDAGTITNATQNSNLTLANPSGNALMGNLVIGNASRGGTGSAVVTLGGNEQILDTAIVSFDGTSGNNPYFKLAGFTETVGGISDYTAQGVIENSENEATSATAGFGTLISKVAANQTYFYNGFIRDRNSVSTNGVNFVKDGAGTQILSGGNISFTGNLQVLGGTLELINTTNANFLSSISTITDNGVLAFQNTSTTAWTFAKNVNGSGGLALIGNPATTTGTITINLTGNITLSGALTATQHQSAITAYNLTGNNTFGTFSLTAPNTGINATLTFGASVATNAVAFNTSNGINNIIGPSATVDFRTAATFASGSVLNVIRGDVLLQPNADGSLAMAGGKLLGLTAINLAGNTADTTFSILNDNSTNGRLSGDRVSDSTAINSKGGKIIFGEVGGGGSVSQSETLGVLSLQAGDLEISTSNLSAGTSSLTFGGNLTSTRSVGGTVNFSGASLGASTNRVFISGILANQSFMGGWVTAGTEWAFYNTGTGVNPFAAGNYTTNSLTGGSSTNVKLTSAVSPLAASATINSLNLQSTTAMNQVINSGQTLTVASGGVMASGQNHQISGPGNITSSSGELDVWVPTSGQTLTIGANVTGSGMSLVKAGLGSLILTGANTYGGNSGKIYINQGTLQVNADTGLGTAPSPSAVAGYITIDGGTLRFGGTMTLNQNRGITILGGGGTLQVDSGPSPTFTPLVVTYNGKIDASQPGGVFTWNGSQIANAANPGGVFNLTSTGNDFSGGFETSSGVTGATDNSAFNIISAGSNNTFGRVRIFGSEVNIGQSASPTTNTFTGDVLMSGGTMTLAGNINFTNSNGTLITLALGNFYLGAANTVDTTRNTANVTSTGPLKVNLLSGIFALAGNNLTINELAGSGTAEIGNFFGDPSNLSARQATLTIDQDSNTTYTGFITDGTYIDQSDQSQHAAAKLNLVKTGSGNLTLSNSANSFSGRITIAGGTLTTTDLSAFQNNSLGTATGADDLWLINGGALRYNGTLESYTFRSFTLGTGEDAGSIIADGTARNAKLHMGIVDVFSGVTASDNVAFTGSGPRTLTLGGFNQGDNEFNLILGDGTGGATSLNKTGNGTWLLTQVNTYSGLTTVSGGILAVTKDGALGSTAMGTILEGGASIQNFSVGGILDLRNVDYETKETLFMNGGELVVTQGNSTWAGTVNVAVNSNIQVTSGESLTLKGSVLDNGGITFLGQGTLILAGDDTGRTSSQATMTVQAGTLVLDYITSKTRKLSNTATLVLGGSRFGGSLVLSGDSTHNVQETVGSLSLQAGLNTISRPTVGDTSFINLNGISVAAGGLLNITLPNIATTDTANKAGGLTLGAWATVGTTDWAVNSGNSNQNQNFSILDSNAHNDTFIRGLSSAASGGYQNNIWGTVAFGSQTIANTDVTASHTANANNTWTLRYNSAGSFAVTLNNPTVIFTGGIMNTANVGANDNFINGSTLTAGNGQSGAFTNQDFIIYQHNTQGSLVINSALVNPPATGGPAGVVGGTIGLEKAGAGALILNNPNNSYRAATIINDGTISVNNLNVTGYAAGSMGIQSTVTSGNNLVYASSAGLTIGQLLTGGNITGTASIVSIPDPYHYVISTNATATGVVTVTLQGATGDFGGTLSVATASGSNTVTVASAAGIVVGQMVSGAGIPAGTYVTGIVPDGGGSYTVSLSNPATVTAASNSLVFAANTSGLGSAMNGSGGFTMVSGETNGSKIITLPSTAGLVVGQAVTGTGIAGGSYIASIDSPTQITLNNNATTTSTTNTLTFQANTAVFLNGGTLQYTGGTTISDRSFNIGFDGKISVTDPNTILTMTGLAQTGGVSGEYTMTKMGEGTLRLNGGTESGYGITGWIADAGRVQLVMAFGNDRYARNDISTLTMSGGAFELVGDTLGSRSQTIPGQLTLTAGQSEIKVSSQIGVTTTLNIQNQQDLLSVVRQPGSALRFVENGGSPTGVANIEFFNTIDLTGVAIPFAVFKDTFFNNDYTFNAQPGVQDLAFINPSNGDVIAADSGSAYKIVTTAATWGTAANPWITSYFSEASSPFSGSTQNTDVHIQLLRYFNKGASTVNITNRLTLDSGTIMIAANIGNNAKTITGTTGGILTSGYGHGYSTNDLLIQNYNFSAPFTIAAKIADYQLSGVILSTTAGDPRVFVGTPVNPPVQNPPKDISAFDVGMTVTGVGIPAGAKVIAVDLLNGFITLDQNATVTNTDNNGTAGKSVNLVATGQSVTKETNDMIVKTVSTSGTPTLGSFILPVNDTTGLVVGMRVSGTGVAPGTTITAVGPGNQVTLSLAATSTQVALGFNFYVVQSVTHTDTWVGTTALSGTNTYTGTTYVEGGVLRLDSAGAIPGGIVNNAIVDNTASHIIIDGGVIGLNSGDFTRGLGTATGQVEFTGSGGFAAYGSDRTVNFGGSNGQLRWDYNNFLINDSTLILSAPDATNMITVSNPIDLGPLNRNVRVDNGFASVDATLSGIISSDGGGLVKFGFGTLALTNNNTYTGGTVVAAGNLVAANPATAFGTGPIGLGTTTDSDVDDKVALTLGAGTLPSGNAITVGNANYESITTINNTANVAIAGAVTLNKKVFLNAASGTTMTLNGAVSGSGGITVIGGGNVLLGGPNTYGTGANTNNGVGIDGGTVIRSGTIHLANSTGLGASTVELGDATSIATAHVAVATNTSSISMKGGVFDATSDATGPNHDGPGAFVNISSTVDGVTFTSSDSDFTPGDGLGKRILVKDDDGNPERNGVYRIVSVTGSTMTIVRDTDFSTTANMVYGYQVVVDGGTSTGLAYFMAAPNVTNVNNPDTDPTAWLQDTVNPNVSLLSDTTGLTINNKIDVNATNGTGTTTIGGSTSLAGTTTYSGNITLQNLLAGIAENKVLFLASSTTSGDGVVFSGVISEADGGAQDSLAITTTNSGGPSGIVTLRGANLYHGLTTIAAGTALRAENGAALGFADGSAGNGTVVNNGGELQIAQDPLLNNVSIGNEALTLNGTGFSNTGALHNITGNNTYGGAITLATSSEITANSGSTLSLSNTITGTASAGLTFGGTGTVNANGVITLLGTNTLTKTDTGTAVLTVANSYSGQTFINNGILQIQNAGSLGAVDNTAATGTTVNPGGELQINVAGSVNIDNEALILGGTGVSSAGALNVLSGNVTYKAPVSLGANASISENSGASLTLDNSTTPITSQAAGNYTLTNVGAGTTTIKSSINTGSGGLAQSGTTTSVLVLNNANPSTYSGATTVTGGTLQVGVGGIGSTGTGGGLPGPVTVSGTSSLSLGTLSGTGTVIGATTLNAFGVLSPGDSGGTSVGRLSFSNGLTLNDSSAANFTVNSPSVTDAITVTGNLTINQSAFTVAFNGYTPIAGQFFDLMDWSGVFSGTFSAGGDINGLRTGGTQGNLTLPDITGLGLQYNVSSFLSNGQISIVAIPEPTRVLLLAFGGFAALMRRRRKSA